MIIVTVEFLKGNELRKIKCSPNYIPVLFKKYTLNGALINGKIIKASSIFQ
jgi:hypothetical protein